MRRAGCSNSTRRDHCSSAASRIIPFRCCLVYDHAVSCEIRFELQASEPPSRKKTPQPTQAINDDGPQLLRGHDLDNYRNALRVRRDDLLLRAPTCLSFFLSPHVCSRGEIFVGSRFSRSVHYSVARRRRLLSEISPHL